MKTKDLLLRSTSLLLLALILLFVVPERNVLHRQ